MPGLHLVRALPGPSGVGGAWGLGRPDARGSCYFGSFVRVSCAVENGIVTLMECSDGTNGDTLSQVPPRAGRAARRAALLTHGAGCRCV